MNNKLTLKQIEFLLWDIRRSGFNAGCSANKKELRKYQLEARDLIHLAMKAYGGEHG